jgi:hypothetical protein
LGGGWKTISKIAGAWAALRFGPSVAKAIFKGLAPKKPTRVVIVGGGTGRGGKGAGAAAGLGGLAAGGIGATAMAKRGSKERKKLAKEKWAERARKKGIEPSKVPTGMKGGLMKRLVKKGGLKVAGRALGSLLGVGFLAGGVMELVEEIPKISAGKGIGAALKDAALGTASFGIYEGSDAPQAKALQEIKSSTTKKARESAKKEDDKTKEIGKQIAMGFIEEMKNNNEPSKIEFKFTFDDIVGANSPVHDILWNSINNSMVKKTA